MLEFFLSLATVFPNGALPAHPRSLPPTDAAGRPVRAPSGSPLTYPSTPLPSVLQLATAAPALNPPTGAASLLAGGDLLWSYVGFGNGIGLSNIRTSIGPGPKEIYCGGSSSTFGANSYWYALRHTPSGNYEQVWSSPFSSTGVVAIEVGDLLPDAGPEIVTVESNARVTIYDQATKVVRAQFQAASGATSGLRLHDFGGDGLQELLLTSATTLYEYSGAGALLFTRAGIGGADLCVGQMDGDPSLEIATTDGRVLDWASNTIQCTRANGFGFRVEAVDIDADGMQELVFADSWSFLWAFDVDTCLPKWSISNFNTGAMRIADADQDGTAELIIGDAQWGNVHAYDLATQAQKWSLANPEHGTTDVWVEDVDGDGQVEVLWGSGATSTGADRLYVGSAQTQTREWENLQLDGPWVGPARGDVDGDGTEELVVVSESTDAGYGAPRIVVFDAATLAVEAISQETSQNLGWEGVGQVRLYDVDSDGNFEIVLATCTTYDGLIEIYDVSAAGGFTRIWRNTTLPSGAVFRSVTIADVDANGSLEVLGGVSGAHTGSAGTYVYCYSLATGNELWHSVALTPAIFSTVQSVEVLDLDLDGRQEIVALVRGGALTILDGPTHTPEAQIAGPFDDLRTWNRVAFQSPTLVCVRPTGDLALYRYRSGLYGNYANVTNPGGGVSGLDIGRGDSVVVGQAGMLKLFKPLPNASWTSTFTSPGIGRGSVLQVPQARIVTTGQLGVFAVRWF